MESEKVTPQTLAAQLAKEKSVAFRVALEKQEETWRLHTIIMDIFPNQPGEETPTYAYEYDRAVFLAGTISGAKAAAWLTPSEVRVSGGERNHKDYTFQTPALQEHINWQRYPRYTEHDYVRIPWPHTRYELYWPNRSTGRQQPEFLVSDEHPFFPSFQAALFDAVYRGTDLEQRSRMSAGESFIIRIARPEAWLENIHISSTATALTITVAGSKKEDAFLEISGPSSLHFKQRIGSESVINCPLTGALPEEWWVVLSRGNRWLDYYHHMARWSTVYGGSLMSPPTLQT